MVNTLLAIPLPTEAISISPKLAALAITQSQMQSLQYGQIVFAGRYGIQTPDGGKTGQLF